MRTPQVASRPAYPGWRASPHRRRRLAVGEQRGPEEQLDHSRLPPGELGQLADLALEAR